MVAEKTEPRSGVVLQIAILAAVVLTVARFGLVSYFNAQMDEEYQRKVGSQKSLPLEKLHQQEQKALTGGPMPIDKAIALMASRPRESLGEKISPQQSTDVAPLVGWGLAPHPVVERPVVDAGATSPTDAGGDSAAPMGSSRPGAPNPAPQPSAAPKK